jgi:hypothetical protein
MECDTSRKLPLATIFPVAHDRKTRLRQLHADLMLAPGMRLHL